jgi:hypothetical protein
MMSNDEPKLPAEQPRLAEQMPDPAGSPQPEKEDDAGLGFISAAGVTVVVVGGLLFAGMPLVGSTRGGTRSARLVWEQRQEQIQQALTEDQTLPGGPTRNLTGEDSADGRSAK